MFILCFWSIFLAQVQVIFHPRLCTEVCFFYLLHFIFLTDSLNKKKLKIQQTSFSSFGPSKSKLDWLRTRGGLTGWGELGASASVLAEQRQQHASTVHGRGQWGNLCSAAQSRGWNGGLKSCSQGFLYSTCFDPWPLHCPKRTLFKVPVLSWTSPFPASDITLPPCSAENSPPRFMVCVALPFAVQRTLLLSCALVAAVPFFHDIPRPCVLLIGSHALRVKRFVSLATEKHWTTMPISHS